MQTKFAAEIIENIEVTAPYFALNNLNLKNDVVQAHITPEQPMENEIGCMSAAEIGRHLAILGSCALANSNPKKEKHYYIAHKASLRSLSSNYNLGESLRAESRTTSFSSRKGVAESVLYGDDEPRYQLSVDYHVIREKVFHKLYREKAVVVPISDKNPYETNIDLNNVQFPENALEASLGPIRPEHCLGHFDSIPCLPVAVLMHSLARSAGLLLSHLKGQATCYRVESAEIDADNFAFAGECVAITARCQEKNGKSYLFVCEAKGEGGKSIGNMCLRLNSVETPN